MEVAPTKIQFPEVRDVSSHPLVPRVVPEVGSL